MNGANNQNISRSDYLRLAKECHPDLHPEDPNALKKFQSLQQSVSTHKSIKNYIVSLTITLQEAMFGCERYFLSNDGQRKYVLKIPAGIKSRTIKYSSIQIEPNYVNTLEIRLTIDLPAGFSFKNGKLVQTITISRWRAFFGGEILIYGPDQNRFRINIPKRLKSGAIFVTKDYGFLKIDLYLEILVRFLL